MRIWLIFFSSIFAHGQRNKSHSEKTTDETETRFSANFCTHRDDLSGSGWEVVEIGNFWEYVVTPHRRAKVHAALNSETLKQIIGSK